MKQNSAISPGSCTTFIVGFVNASIVQNGQSTGLYFIDTRTSAGSKNEGTDKLSTTCPNQEKIAWVVFPFSPTDGAEIQSIGNSNAWGYSGQPFGSADDIFTGQVQSKGNASYQIDLNVRTPDGNINHPSTNLNLNVQ